MSEREREICFHPWILIRDLISGLVGRVILIGGGGAFNVL